VLVLASTVFLIAVAFRVRGLVVIARLRNRHDRRRQRRQALASPGLGVLVLAVVLDRLCNRGGAGGAPRGRRGLGCGGRCWRGCGSRLGFRGRSRRWAGSGSWGGPGSGSRSRSRSRSASRGRLRRLCGLRRRPHRGGSDDMDGLGYGVAGEYGSRRMRLRRRTHGLVNARRRRQVDDSALVHRRGGAAEQMSEASGGWAGFVENERRQRQRTSSSSNCERYDQRARQTRPHGASPPCRKQFPGDISADGAGN
jgi:hypothetical protein